MRILHLNELYPPLVLGGAERSVAMLAEAQSKAGHEVFVACTTPEAFAVEIREGVTVYRMPHESCFWSEDWPNHSPLERVWRKFKMPFNRGMRAHFEHVLDTVKPDIVNTHSMNDVTTSCWTSVARKSIPLVHTLRNYDLICANAAMYHNGDPCGLRCRVISAAKRRHHHAIRGVIANSQETLRIHVDAGLFTHIPAHLRKAIWSISGIDPRTSPRPLLPSSTPFTFGYFGRLTEEKGVGTLIEAARLLGSDKDFRIHIAGKVNAGAAQFVEQAHGLPVNFQGFVDGARFFANTDVLILPSIWPEPLPRTALEAYAAGVPVLSSRAGGTPDLVGHDNADWLFEPGNAMELAGHMDRIIRLGRQALPNPDQFRRVLDETHPEVVLERYLHFYHDVMAFHQRH